MENEKDMLELSCYDFLERLASNEAVPGGGGASALCGCIGMALGRMAGELTLGKPKYANVQEDIKALLERSEDLQAKLSDAVTKDAECFEPLSLAYKIPKDNPGRDAVMEDCLKKAASVPLDILELSCEGVLVMKEFAEKASKLVISDAATGTAMCLAAMQGAAINVKVNTKLMKDRDFAEKINKHVDERMARFTEIGRSVIDKVYGEF